MGENGSDDEFYDCPEVKTSFLVVVVVVFVFEMTKIIANGTIML